MSRVESRKPRAVQSDRSSGARPSTLDPRLAFTLIEVLVVVTLLSLIVVALMGVFTATQKAFRASLTQTDVLEGGRAAMDLITGDLKAMSPSLDYSNGAVNFYANTNLNYAPLVQPLIASGNSRMNILEKFFILSRENQTWTGTGYAVNTASTGSINPLYRFSMSTNVAASNPWQLFYYFTNAVANNFNGMSHLLDGVVTLRVRAYDNNGYWMTNTFNFAGAQTTTNQNVQFLLPSALGETGFLMFSNTLPSAVEVEMATFEDRTLQRASVWPNNSPAQNGYLAQQAGNVHVFRQRVSIPNFNATAYQ
jgi:type II secretory pathway pseudopilin PulG